jgi:hypothetical protein
MSISQTHTSNDIPIIGGVILRTHTVRPYYITTSKTRHTEKNVINSKKGGLSMENNLIMLSEEQRKELEVFAKNGVHNAHLISRAKTILALDRSNKKDHLRITRICEQIGLSRQAIYDMRNDFLRSPSISDFLTRKKRETPPVPAKVTGEVEAHIIALACSEPPKGYVRWTLKLLAEKSVELSFVDSLSDKTVERLLKKRNISLI